ncbi:MAG: cation diffusion facilitator family transporter [Coxiella sp. (in: Bacteria)]|nr:MAG: cation diffusion facilitator family transporter [Coxiella sp. (in: g-proteobacteria)]
MHESIRLKTTRRVSLVSALTNTVLAILKIIIGVIGNSHALIADGVHSFTDLISDALVYFAAKFGERHADEGHPYGHHRIETIAAIIIALLLVAVGIGIIYDSVEHFISKSSIEVYSTPVIVIATFSIIANEWLFRYTFAAGKKVHSNLLITNAWHNRGDAFVSAIVLLSVIGSLFGIHYLDSIGAVIIALLILKTASSMIRNSFNELIDAAVDPDTLKHFHTAILDVNGVQNIHMLRTRLHAGNIFVDVHILVDPKISVSEGHYISDQVYKALIHQFEMVSDITVHIDPEDDEAVKPSLNSPNREDLEFRLREHWKSLPGHNDIQRILIHYLDGKLQIDVFILKSAVTNHDIETLLQKYRDAAKGINDIEKIELHLTI